MLENLNNIKELHFITNYNSNVILKCCDRHITGNLVGEHLIGMDYLPLCNKNSCQWEYLSAIYGIPYYSCITLLGNAEQNWINHSGYHKSLNFLLSYWVGEGFRRVIGTLEDFPIQLHNLNLYMGYNRKEQLELITKEILISSRSFNAEKVSREKPGLTKL